MSDMQQSQPGAPGTTEGEAGPSESDPSAPSVEGRPGGDDEEEGVGSPS
jgi:hypothetical protein